VGTVRLTRSALMSSLIFLPNYILVISSVDECIHFPVIGVPKQDATFKPLAKNYVGSLRYQ
jgi:hypothetical protein